MHFGHDGVATPHSLEANRNAPKTIVSKPAPAALAPEQPAHAKAERIQYFYDTRTNPTLLQLRWSMPVLTGVKLLFAFFTFLAAVQAQENSWLKEPDGFKGLKFGGTEDELREMAVGGSLRCANNPHDTVEWEKAHPALANPPRLPNRFCFYRIEVAKFALLTYFQFRDDHFNRITGTFSSDYFTDVKAIFLDTYGPPSSTEQEVVQTKTGAQYTQEKLTWIGKKLRLYVAKYGSTIDEGLFGLAQLEDLDKASQAQEEANKKALK